MFNTLIIFTVLASCAVSNPVNYTAEEAPNVIVTVWTGQNLTLSCEDEKELALFHRIWRKGPALLTASTVIITLDDRFQIVNEHILTLNNVSLSDEGEYVCEIIANPPIKKKFSIYVSEVVCGEPDLVPNGSVDPEPGTADAYRYGDEAVYTCHEGYVLVGEPLRICLHPDNGWEGETPKCELPKLLKPKWQEPKYYTMKEVAEVNQRVNKLESKLSKFFTTDMQVFHRVEEKFSALETRVKQLEGDTGDVKHNRNKNEHIEREVHHLKKALSLNALRGPWETFLNTDVARLGVSDGQLVSEYTWFVRDFDSKLKEYRNLNFDYIESRPFYTHVPGYQMVLHVYPNYDQTDHIGFFAILLPGRFDEVIAWPFTSKYMLSIASVDSESSDVYDTIVPVRATECKFEKPPPDNNIGCGFAAFLEHSVLHEKAHLHKTNGGVLFRMTIFLDD